jgi:hypothetical protein
MRTSFLTIAAFVGLFTACGSSNKGGGTVTCGTLTCKVNEVCSTQSSSPVCTCATGYTGSSCSSCASGYQMTNGVCILAPIDCSRTTSCGGHGTCLNSTCTCSTGYTGTACESCAEGYQDNDKNGTCLVTCTNSASTVTCSSPQTCADTSGRAICSCPPGSSGTSCSSCLSGYTRQANGTCIMCPANTTGEACADCVTGYIKQPDGSCAPCPMFSTGLNCESCVSGYAKDPATGKCVKSCTSNSQCGTHGYCDIGLPVPNCTCQPGYTGATCADCAPNYVRDTANQCILAAIPGGTAFIGAGLVAGVNSLLAIDPSGSTVTPIRPLPSTSITQLAADVDNKVLYTLDNTGIKKLDFATGAQTAVATLASSSNLTWGPGGLFSIPNLSPYLLKRINVTNGAIADLGTTALSSVQALAFDASSGALIAARWATSSPELHRVSASDGTTTPMGTLTFDPAALPPSNTRIGIATDPNTGFVYAATSMGRTPQALFTKHCSQVAAGVGLIGYDTASVSAMEYPATGIGVGLTKVLGSAAESGKEVIAYASNATMGATPAVLRIETANPEAFVCLMTSNENLKVVLASTAKFAGIVFTGNRPRLAMEVEGVREVTSPLVHIALTSETYLDASVRAYAINRVYTSAEWSTQKKLPYVTSLWGSDSTAPTRLVQLDLATNKPARVLALNGVELQNLLAPWKP